jgi:hypothetical protein
MVRSNNHSDGLGSMPFAGDLVKMILKLNIAELLLPNERTHATSGIYTYLQGLWSAPAD